MAGVFASYGPQESSGRMKPQPRSLGGIPGSYGLYNTAVEQQAGDYGNIMGAYKGLQNGPAMNNLAELSATGGYSEADKSNIRERGISPIRSIYSSANRDIERQKGLQGGYSPNYTAAKAKMAREMSSVISDKTTDVNAQLAQAVAQNRIGLAPQYTNAAIQPVQGQQSLYGTTPALANTFGNQALGAAQLQNQINQAPTISQQPRRPGTGGVRIGGGY